MTDIKNAVKEIHPYRIPEKVAELEEMLGVGYRETDPLFQEWLPLRWQDVKDMEAEGLVSFGGHTANHSILSRLDATQALREIVDCRSALDRHLSRRTTFWAYPNGTRRDFNDSHVEMLKANSFQTILLAEPGHICRQSDISMLPRIGVSNRMDARDIEELLARMDHPKQQQGRAKKSPAWAGLGKGSMT